MLIISKQRTLHTKYGLQNNKAKKRSKETSKNRGNFPGNPSIFYQLKEKKIYYVDRKKIKIKQEKFQWIKFWIFIGYTR